MRLGDWAEAGCEDTSNLREQVARVSMPKLYHIASSLYLHLWLHGEFPMTSWLRNKQFRVSLQMVLYDSLALFESGWLQHGSTLKVALRMVWRKSIQVGRTSVYLIQCTRRSEVHLWPNAWIEATDLAGWSQGHQSDMIGKLETRRSGEMLCVWRYMNGHRKWQDICVPHECLQRATSVEADVNNQISKKACPVAISQLLSPAIPVLAQYAYVSSGYSQWINRQRKGLLYWLWWLILTDKGKLRSYYTMEVKRSMSGMQVVSREHPLHIELHVRFKSVNYHNPYRQGC